MAGDVVVLGLNRVGLTDGRWPPNKRARRINGGELVIVHCAHNRLPSLCQNQANPEPLLCLTLDNQKRRKNGSVVDECFRHDKFRNERFEVIRREDNAPAFEFVLRSGEPEAQDFRRIKNTSSAVTIGEHSDFASCFYAHGHW